MRKSVVRRIPINLYRDGVVPAIISGIMKVSVSNVLPYNECNQHYGAVMLVYKENISR